MASSIQSTSSQQHRVEEPPPYEPRSGNELSSEDSAFLESKVPLPLEIAELDRGVFHWHVSDWAHMDATSKENNSGFEKEFEIAGMKWRLWIYPQGMGDTGHIALRVQSITAASKPQDWDVCVHTFLLVANYRDAACYQSSTCRHRLSCDSPNVAYKTFMTRSELNTRQTYNNRPLLEDNRFRISFYVRIADDPTGVLWHDFRSYNSLKMTGHIGLTALDSCQPLNPLLQALLQIKPLQDATAKASRADFDTRHLLVLVVGELFANMRSSKLPLNATKVQSTLEALGIKPPSNLQLGGFTEQILHNITGSLRSAVPGCRIDSLISGKMQTVSQQLQTSSTSSSFFRAFRGPEKLVTDSALNPIILNVSGLADVKQALRDFTSHRVVSGVNRQLFKTSTEGTWTECNRIVELPSVLFMSLKRFVPSTTNGSPTRLATEFTYDETLDMADYAPHLSNSKMSTRYTLYGVFIHRGDASKGRHFCILRPSVDERWLLFDDEIVLPVMRRHALDNYTVVDFTCSYGIAERQKEIYEAMGSFNAYMLIYVRDSEIKYILGHENGVDRSAQSGSSSKN